LHRFGAGQRAAQAKALAWYDNKWGHWCRLPDVAGSAGWRL